MITIDVTGDAAVVARFTTMPGRIAARLKMAITAQVFALVAVVKKDKLSGQQLQRRTGRLSRSVNGRVTEAPGVIAGQVGTNVSYAAAHEFGFTGTVTVREHLRTVRQAFGRPIAPVQATVAAHARQMRVPERSFLRSALRERTPTIRAALAAAVAEGAA